MNNLNPREIGTALEQRRQRNDAHMRRDAEAMDAFVGHTVQTLNDGLELVVEDLNPWRLEPVAETAPVAKTPAARKAVRSAIEARRNRPASSSPAPEPGESPLRAALRGIVEDYAQPITPADRIVSDLQAFSGVALDEADSYGLWADLELAEVLGVRAAMRDVVEVVTDRAETIIIAELVAAQGRLAIEYPDAPRPDAPDSNDRHS